MGSLIPDKISPIAAGEATVAGQKEAITDVLPGERVRQIEVEKISPNPLQPREHFDYGDLEDLVDSIKKHGILQPLIVAAEADGTFQLIAGERRLRAAKILELKTVPCLARTAVALEKLEIALIENIQRSDLNPLEEATAFQKLIDEFNLTQEEVGAKVGKKRATVANALRLLSLPEEIKKALRESKITAAHAKVILSVPAEAERVRLFKKILQFNLTVAEADSEIKQVAVKSHHRLLAKDPELKDKEDSLRRALGTKVAINQKGNVGSIVIEYYSLEELNGLIEKLSK